MPAALVDSKIQDFFHYHSICIWISAASQLEIMLPYSLAFSTISFQHWIWILIPFVLLHLYDIGSPGYMPSNNFLTFIQLCNNVTFGSPPGTLDGFHLHHFHDSKMLTLTLCGWTFYANSILQQQIAFVASCPNTISMPVKCLLSSYVDGHFTLIQFCNNKLYLSAYCPNTIFVPVKCLLSSYLDGHFTLARWHSSVDPDLVLREWRHSVLIWTVKIITRNTNTTINKT